MGIGPFDALHALFGKFRHGNVVVETHLPFPFLAGFYLQPRDWLLRCAPGDRALRELVLPCSSGDAPD
ncbi:MAG: hypothetical protein H5T86_12715 [Armatimonadetes bacterium]|nr:hypothetical protein [Armatimonadota bacterium]